MQLPVPKDPYGTTALSSQNVSDRILDKLDGAGEIAIDRWLCAEVRYLKDVYKRGGDPRIVSLAATTISERVSEVPASSRSFQFARLLSLTAEMLIAEGQNHQTLSTALLLTNQADETLQRVPVYSAEWLRERVCLALYRATAQKALGKIDDAIKSIRQTVSQLANDMDASYADMIMLHRQEVMMQQEPAAHRVLAERAIEYARAKPVEYYGTIKRVFEFAMNRKLLDAGRIYPEFRRAFSAVRHRLPPISHVSFSKNVGQMLGQQGDLAKATAVLHSAAKSAVLLNLHGQRRQLEYLIDDIRQNTSRGLVTFIVGS